MIATQLETLYRIEKIDYNEEARTAKSKKKKASKRKEKYKKIKDHIKNVINEIGNGFEDEEDKEGSTTCSKANFQLGNDMDSQNEKYVDYESIKKLKITGDIGQSITSDQISAI